MTKDQINHELYGIIKRISVLQESLYGVSERLDKTVEEMGDDDNTGNVLCSQDVVDGVGEMLESIRVDLLSILDNRPVEEEMGNFPSF